MKMLFCSTALIAAMAVPAFGQEESAPAEDGAATAEMAASGATAQATLEGDGIEGTVTFTETPTGIMIVEIEASGLEPGPHGVHLHQTGSCDAEGGHESAGGHIAGEGEHGVMNENGPHPGDLPNVHVQDDGIAHAEFFVGDVTITAEGPATLMDDDGSAFVIHAGPDDYTTDPAGDSGDRIACGVIEQAT
ncbi:superoxide dismutase family protein [Pararhizobium haloflavum]|uniref:superoxide dismutase family protein n=1 Tax=Pararhizobium haloflavum TaxID=2037914 RepID=UPI0018E47437|nr:superoxide dismutase family protein [Pararhizobium haloflavum]